MDGRHSWHHVTLNLLIVVLITGNIHLDNSPDQCHSLRMNYRRLKYAQLATYHTEYLHVQVLINYANKYRHTFQVFKFKVLFKVYGEAEVQTIATHFYPKDKEASQQLKDEWQNFKHNLLKMKGMRPKRVKAGTSTHTSIAWILLKVLSERNTYDYFFPAITKLADVSASAPITNASPE